MGKHPHRAFALSFLFLLVASSASAVESGDFMCDVRDSTLDTCVIAGSFVVPSGTMLRFTKNNVRVRGTVTVGFVGQCTTDPPSTCASDVECAAPGRCLRTGVLRIEVRGLLEIAARAQVLARGQVVAGDVAPGPNGGNVTIVARQLTVAGTVDASAVGLTGVTAGDGGRIMLTADESVTLAEIARLDTSTARGGCGGSITVGGAETLEMNGTITTDGATRGGYIDLNARAHTVVTGALQASNTDADLRTRPVCADDPRPSGGGKIRVRAPQIELTGAARARGKEGAGGTVEIEAVRALTIDSNVGTAAISVSGGGVDALQPGGVVMLTSTGGDVIVRRGTIEADGQSVGLGSDAGVFIIEAHAASRCLAADTPCSITTACPTGDACVEKGGAVDVQAPLSAAGGAGGGFGCVACSIHGGADVSVSNAIDVGGGRQVGGGGKLTITGGGDLSVGPGPITATAADGGDVVLLAGERTGAAANVGGALRIVTGTQIRAQARDPGGAAGNIQISGCDVSIEPSVVLDVTLTRGGTGQSGSVEVTARERLTIEALAAMRALPDGTLALSHRSGATVAPDAIFEPPATPIQDPALEPCPACGNGVTDATEECDGPGSCPGDAVCVPPGTADACTCADTCGTVPGVQNGEECDGADLGGQTCQGLGFPGGALTCTPDCTLDTSGCEAAVCGDGLVAPEEACDVGGIDGAEPSFAGETCQTLGFPDGGALACAPDCSAIIGVPHCATSVTVACLRASDCPEGEACVAGCLQCGNGFVDTDEECDEGTANGSEPNRCRDDCHAPSCGDGTLDFQHCSGDPEVPCGDDRDCAAGQTCVAGERCDEGAAVCLGGERNGEPCCRESDCPGGDCSGDDCSANRDDVPGCCRCTCAQEACGNGVTEEGEECDDGNRESGDCCSPACRFELAGSACADDGNPCTDDQCNGIGTCAHDDNASACDDGDACTVGDACADGACAAGPPLDCDDHDRCTTDGCSSASGCFHTPVLACCRVLADCFDGNICTVDSCDASGHCQNPRFGYTDARSAVERSLVIEPCLGQSLPARFGRLLGKAGTFIDRARSADDSKRRDRFLGRARRRLRTAVRTAEGLGPHRVTGTCAAALGDVTRSLLERTECLRGALP